jgi:hypothetical protein
VGCVVRVLTLIAPFPKPLLATPSHRPFKTYLKFHSQQKSYTTTNTIVVSCYDEQHDNCIPTLNSP